jgi:hypothetical protein
MDRQAGDRKLSENEQLFVEDEYLLGYITNSIGTNEERYVEYF